VYAEIEDLKDPTILELAKNQVEMFVKLDIAQCKEAQDILQHYPLVHWQKKKPKDADVFVVALAVLKGRGWTVISNEKRKEGKTKIPYVCDRLGIKCLNHWQFLEELDLKVQQSQAGS